VKDAAIAKIFMKIGDRVNFSVGLLLGLSNINNWLACHVPKKSCFGRILFKQRKNSGYKKEREEISDGCGIGFKKRDVVVIDLLVCFCVGCKFYRLYFLLYLIVAGPNTGHKSCQKNLIVPYT
jgi:hypothetical protein